MSSTKRINVWSSPRNISTAFMYAFAQRPDMTVVDEPLYAHYLTHTDTEADHPGREEILASQANDAATVIEQVIFGPYPTPLVLFKQMTHHLISIDTSFLLRTENVLLIRDPRAIIASYAKVIPNPSMRDVGIAQQLQLFRKLQDAGKNVQVVDARELLLNPEGVLKKLCGALEIPFIATMLHWEAGPKPEDGVWAKYWYEEVHRSTGFLPYQEKKIELPAHLQSLAEACQPYYQQLFEFAILS